MYVILDLGINVRVLDLFTIKPLDKEAIISNVKECNGNIVTVEDHYPEGSARFSLPSIFISFPSS